MEMNTGKRLDKIITDLELMYVESKGNIPIKQKFETYKRATVLNTEALYLLEKIRSEVMNLNCDNIDMAQVTNINHYIGLLNEKNSIDEILQIISRLTAISKSIPNTIVVNDNINKNAVHEII